MSASTSRQEQDKYLQEGLVGKGTFGCPRQEFWFPSLIFIHSRQGAGQCWHRCHLRAHGSSQLVPSQWHCGDSPALTQPQLAEL